MELLLLLCLYVSTCTEKTSADENGVVTVNVSLGKDVILPCSPTTKEDLSFKSFKWRKDGQNVFYYDAGSHYNNGLRGQDPQFKERVSFFKEKLRSGDASIQIQNVMIQDSGIYSCEISGLNSGIQTFNIKLVGDVPTHHATLDSDVILPCSLPGKDLRQEVFAWKKDGQDVFLYAEGKHYNNGLQGQNENFKNRVEFFQDHLQFGDASIRIKNTRLSDSGNYSCEFPHPQSPGQTFYIMLVVQCINLKDRTQHSSGNFSSEWREVTGYSKATVIGLAVALVVLAVVFCLCKGKHPDMFHAVMCCPGREGNTVKSTGDRTKDRTNLEDVPLQD